MRTEITIVAPLGAIQMDAHASRHVDVQLDREQANMLKRIRAGCDDQNARLANGRRVVSNADVIRYLLELTAGQASANEGYLAPPA